MIYLKGKHILGELQEPYRGYYCSHGCSRMFTWCNASS